MNSRRAGLPRPSSPAVARSCPASAGAITTSFTRHHTQNASKHERWHDQQVRAEHRARSARAPPRPSRYHRRVPRDQPEDGDVRTEPEDLTRGRRQSPRTPTPAQPRGCRHRTGRRGSCHRNGADVQYSRRRPSCYQSAAKRRSRRQRAVAHLASASLSAAARLSESSRPEVREYGGRPGPVSPASVSRGSAAPAPAPRTRPSSAVDLLAVCVVDDSRSAVQPRDLGDEPSPSSSVASWNPRSLRLAGRGDSVPGAPRGGSAARAARTYRRAFSESGPMNVAPRKPVFTSPGRD